MRTYILTRREYAIIIEYIKDGVKLEGFNMLTHRISKNYADLQQDMEYIRIFLNAIEDKEGKQIPF